MKHNETKRTHAGRAPWRSWAKITVTRSFRFLFLSSFLLIPLFYFHSHFSSHFLSHLFLILTRNLLFSSFLCLPRKLRPFLVSINFILDSEILHGTSRYQLCLRDRKTLWINLNKYNFCCVQIFGRNVRLRLHNPFSTGLFV